MCTNCEKLLGWGGPCDGASGSFFSGGSIRCTYYYGSRRAMDPSAISEQIDRILRSRSLASKSQLRKLLQVLHKNMDSQVTLKPDQVIKELWPAEIRTKRSADVAAEMNRLRHALKSYYEDEGGSDPVTIVLPNRAAGAGNETRERLWIVAKP